MLSVFIQKILKVNRLKKVNCPLCKCQQWFSITGACAAYILSQKEFIKRFVKYNFEDLMKKFFVGKCAEIRISTKNEEETEENILNEDTYNEKHG